MPVVGEKKNPGCRVLGREPKAINRPGNNAAAGGLKLPKALPLTFLLPFSAGYWMIRRPSGHPNGFLSGRIRVPVHHRGAEDAEEPSAGRGMGRRGEKADTETRRRGDAGAKPAPLPPISPSPHLRVGLYLCVSVVDPHESDPKMRFGCIAHNSMHYCG